MADKHVVLFVGQAQAFGNFKLNLQKMLGLELHHIESAAVEEMKKVHTEIVVAESADSHERTCALLEELSAKQPDSVLLLLSPKKPAPDQLLQYMHYGVREIITHDDNPEPFLQNAVALLTRRAAAGTADAARIGRVLSFFSAKGGVGKTILAVSTGRVFGASPNLKTILVDFDLQFGDMDLYLGANSMQTIGELFEEIKNNSGRMSDFILDSHVHQISPHFHLLSAPLSPEKAELITAEGAGLLLKVLKKRYDFILIDTSAVLSDVTLSLFDKSDRIFLVLDDEMAAIKNAGQTWQLLKKLNYPDTKVDFIVNNQSDKFPMEEGMLVKVLTKKPFIRIPAAPLVHESINEGYSLMEKHPEDPAAQAILDFARKLAGEAGVELEVAATGGKRSGLLPKVKQFFFAKS